MGEKYKDLSVDESSIPVFFNRVDALVKEKDFIQKFVRTATIPYWVFYVVIMKSHLSMDIREMFAGIQWKDFGNYATTWKQSVYPYPLKTAKNGRQTVRTGGRLTMR